MRNRQMKRIGIDHGSLVFVADGGKAIFLHNAGDALYPNFRTIGVLDHENPPTREQGTGAAGRTFKRAHTNRRSAVAATDWHDVGEQQFVKKAAAELERLVQQLDAKSIVIAAPPRALADLRAALPAKMRRRVVAEIDKDFTRHPLSEIEKRVLEATR